MTKTIFCVFLFDLCEMKLFSSAKLIVSTKKLKICPCTLSYNLIFFDLILCEVQVYIKRNKTICLFCNKHFAIMTKP